MTSKLPPYSRITGDQRAELLATIKTQYEGGLSIRAIAEAHGRSYGAVHGMLAEAGVQLRGRGGRHDPPGRELTDEEARAYRERLAKTKVGRKR